MMQPPEDLYRTMRMTDLVQLYRAFVLDLEDVKPDPESEARSAMIGFCSGRIAAIATIIHERGGPFDHNAECMFCDEQGEHDPSCPFFP